MSMPVQMQLSRIIISEIHEQHPAAVGTTTFHYWQRAME